MKTHPMTLADRREGGFSLIEVTIAIAITAIALVSLMGMLPQGMETMRQASDRAVEARIHQQVLGEVQLTPWKSADGSGNPPIEKYDKQIRYYDDQGIELLASDKGSFEHVYTARIHVPSLNGSPRLPESVGGDPYPGTSVPGDVQNKDLRLVIVEITSLTVPNFDFDKPEFKDEIRTFQTVLAKLGQEYEATGTGGAAP